MMGMGGKGGGGKDGGKGKPKREFKIDLKSFSDEQKVWIGGIPEGAAEDDIKQLLEASAGEVKAFTFMKKGTVCAVFESGDAAATAIATVNGTEFGEGTLDVDVWTQKP